jgi:hypothetical protein
VLHRPQLDCDDSKHFESAEPLAPLHAAAAAPGGPLSRTFVALLENEAASVFWPISPAQRDRVAHALQTGVLHSASSPIASVLAEPSVSASLSIRQHSSGCWFPVIPHFVRDQAVPAIFRLPWDRVDSHSSIIWDSAALSTFWLDPTGPTPLLQDVACLYARWERFPAAALFGVYRGSSPVWSDFALRYLEQGRALQRSGFAQVGMLPGAALQRHIAGQSLLDQDEHQLRSLGLSLGRLAWVIRSRVLALRRIATSSASCPAALRALVRDKSAPPDLLAILPVPLPQEERDHLDDVAQDDRDEEVVPAADSVARRSLPKSSTRKASGRRLPLRRKAQR